MFPGGRPFFPISLGYAFDPRPRAVHMEWLSDRAFIHLAGHGYRISCRGTLKWCVERRSDQI